MHSLSLEILTFVRFFTCRVSQSLYCVSLKDNLGCKGWSKQIWLVRNRDVHGTHMPIIISATSVTDQWLPAILLSHITYLPLSSLGSCHTNRVKLNKSCPISTSIYDVYTNLGGIYNFLCFIWQPTAKIV